MYDTVKGSDWLGDQAIEYLVKKRHELLSWRGMVFLLAEPMTEKFTQRPFGGMTKNYGNGTAQRTCAAADRTGHAILHTLYGQALKQKYRIFLLSTLL